MTYKVIDASSCKMEDTGLPESVRAQLKENGSFLILGSSDNGDAASLGAFSLNESADTAHLLWIYTGEAYRELGAASGLLVCAEDVLSKMGVRILDCQVTAPIDQAEELYEFLTIRGFETEFTDGQIYEYRYEDVADRLKQLVPMKKRGIFSRLSKMEIAFQMKEERYIPAVMRDIFLQEADPELSVFWCQKGILMAGIAVEKEENEARSIRALYLNGDASDQAGVLLQMLDQAVNESAPQDVNKLPLYFSVDDKKYRKLYRKLFGKPVREYWVQKYKRQIG